MPRAPTLVALIFAALVAGTSACDSPIVVDNSLGAPYFVASGSWTTVSGPAYEGGSALVGSSVTLRTAVFTPAVPTPGQYDVQLHYAVLPGNGESVDVVVKYGEHALGHTAVTVDMTENAAADGYVSLGFFYLRAGLGNTTVTLTTIGAGGNVVADAVRLVCTGTTNPPTTTAGVDMTCTAGVDEFAFTTNDLDAFRASAGWRPVDSYLDSAGAVNLNAFFSAASLPAGEYDVQIYWTAGPNRATAAAFTVTHEYGTTPLVVDQTQSVSDVTFYSLGSYTFASHVAAHGIDISSTSSSGLHLIVDAVRFVCLGAPVTTTPPAPVCDYGPVDLVYVLDTSGSMSAESRALMLDFTAQLTAALPVSVGPAAGDSRVAAINFDTNAAVDFIFSTYTTSAAVETALRAIVPTADNGATATHSAISKLINQVLQTTAGWRNGTVPTLVVFVTDGGATLPDATATQIGRLNTTYGESVERYAIGVGNYVYDQLLMLAYSKPENVKQLVDFNGLSGSAFRAEMLDTLFCVVPTTTTSTTTPTTTVYPDTCALIGCDNAGAVCDCTSACLDLGNCCPDYYGYCIPTTTTTVSPTTISPTTVSPTTVPPRCRYAPVDMVYVLDTSGSMSADNRALMLDFTARLTAALPVPVGPSDAESRVAAINFDATAVVDFGFSAYTVSSSVETALRAIQPTVDNGGTATHSAISKLINSVLQVAAGWRNNTVPTIVVFVTDGGASLPDLTATQIGRLNATFGDTINRYAIGVGDYVYDQLVSLAYSRADHVKELDTFTGFSEESFRAEMLDTIFCLETTTTTTVSPTTVSPTTVSPTTVSPTSLSPTSVSPTTVSPTSMSPTSESPTSMSPTSESPTSVSPTTVSPTTVSPTSESPTSVSPTTVSPTSVSPTTVPPRCRYSPIDLVYVLDTSGSMSAENRDLMLDFTANLTAALPVPVGPSETDSRVAAINFDATAKVDFTFSTYSTPAAVEAALRAVQPTAVNGGTATHSAISKLISNVLQVAAGWRNNAVPTIVVFVTDGGASLPASTATQIGRLNTTFGDTVERYAIGVGDYVYDQLLMLAFGYADRVKELADFTTFSQEAFQTEMQDTIFCRTTSTTTTTVSPTTASPTSQSPTSTFGPTMTTSFATSISPTTNSPTTLSPTTLSPTTEPTTTESMTTEVTTTESPTTESPTTESPTTEVPTTEAATTTLATDSPTTESPATDSPTTESPTSVSPSTASTTMYEPTFTTFVPTMTTLVPDTPTTEPVPLTYGLCQDGLFDGGAPCACAAGCVACNMTSRLEPLQCVMCGSFEKLLQGVCVSSCPAGYITIGSGAEGQLCVAGVGLPVCSGHVLSTDGSYCTCDVADCYRCHMFDGVSVDCISCKNSKYLLDNACLATCPANYNANGGGSFGRTCTAIVTTTTTTIAPASTSCQYGLYDSVTPCACNEAACGICAMDSQLVANECLLCTNFEKLLHGTCVAACPAGYATVGSGAAGQVCVEIAPLPTCSSRVLSTDGSACACGTDCAACHMFDGLPVDCITCKNSKYLLDNACIAACPVDYNSVGGGSFGRYCASTATTLSPEPLYYATCQARLFDGSAVACACGSDCHACNMTSDLVAHECFTCKNYAKLLGDACVPECPPGFAAVGAGSFGQYCVELAVQAECSGRVLSTDGSACTCNLDSCHTCHLLSGRALDCSLCANSQFLLNNSVCVDVCPAGYTGRGTGSFGRTCVRDVPTAVSTTLAPGSLLTCTARLVVGSTTPCACSSNCYSCDLANTGAAGTCRRCKNSRYLDLELGVCVSTCPIDTVPTGLGVFGRRCMPKPKTCIGRALLETGAPCLCRHDCHRCMWTKNRMVPGTCTICKDSAYLDAAEGECVAACPNGTLATGSGVFGRRCL